MTHNLGLPHADFYFSLQYLWRHWSLCFRSQELTCPSITGELSKEGALAHTWNGLQRRPSETRGKSKRASSCLPWTQLWPTPEMRLKQTHSILEVEKPLPGLLSQHYDRLMSLGLVSQTLSADEDHYIFPAPFSFEKIVNFSLTVLKIFRSCLILRNAQQGLQKWITASDGEIKPSSFQGKVHYLTDGNTPTPYSGTWDVEETERVTKASILLANILV